MGTKGRFNLYSLYIFTIEINEILGFQILISWKEYFHKILGQNKMNLKTEQFKRK